MIPLSLKRRQFPPTTIRHSIWLYVFITSNLRDVEEMLVERGMDGSYETTRRRFMKFGPVHRRQLARLMTDASNHRHLDEIVDVIRGRQFWLWQAVNNEGEVVDCLVQPRRDAKAAIRLVKKLLQRQ